VRPSILDPVSYQQANVIGLQNLLDFAKETNANSLFLPPAVVYMVSMIIFPGRKMNS
jgi:UDP-glucose 4-epimerase